MKFLANAFSTRMLTEACNVHFQVMEFHQFKNAVQAPNVAPELMSCIGHPGAAQFLSSHGIPCQVERRDISLAPGDMLFLIDIDPATSPRLAPGAELTAEQMEGMSVRYWCAAVRESLASVDITTLPSLQSYGDLDIVLRNLETALDECDKAVDARCGAGRIARVERSNLFPSYYDLELFTVGEKIPYRSYSGEVLPSIVGILDGESLMPVGEWKPAEPIPYAVGEE